MNRLVRQVDTKWLPRLLLAKELNGAFRQKVRDISLCSLSLTVGVQDGVEAFALAGETPPPIEPGPRTIVIAHVPFPEKSGGVTGIVQQPRPSNKSATLLRPIRVIDDSVAMRVLPGKKAGPAWRA